MNNTYIIFGIAGICFSVILFIVILINRSVNNFLEFKKRQSYIEKHDIYVIILNYYMEKAYELIYKDRILVYSIEGTKPDEHIISQYTKDFTKLTLKMLGGNLRQEFINLYGDEDTLIFTIVEFFNVQSENDEIKQASMDNIMEGSGNETI